MNEFFNWNDTSIIWSHNWWWIVAAFAVGAWAGWRTCDTTPDNSK